MMENIDLGFFTFCTVIFFIFVFSSENLESLRNTNSLDSCVVKHVRKVRVIRAAFIVLYFSLWIYVYNFGIL
jgi:hypothetical protein